MRSVLITGATGVLGSTLVPLFLTEPGTVVRLVLRASSDLQLRERLGQLFAFWELSPSDPAIAGRVEAFRGDVSAPKLGVGEENWERLSGEVTHVVHAAGNVRLNQPLKEARKSAVEAARHVVAFCQACQCRGRFAKLEFVSTVGIAGRTPGLIRERPYLEPREFRNTYEAAKAEAEEFVWRNLERGLPATIYRPSMIVGDSRTGKTVHFQVFYYLSEFLAGMKTWGFVPETGRVKLDIIPSDCVAQAIQLGSGRPEATGRIMHLCSGPGHAVRVADLIPRLCAFYQANGVTLPALRLLPPDWMRLALPLVSRLAPPKRRRMLDSLPFFLDYLKEEQEFDNGRTQAFFSGDCLRIPPAAEYLERVLGYYWAKKHRPHFAGRGGKLVAGSAGQEEPHGTAGQDC
jgi:thioester reductase-like protein